MASGTVLTYDSTSDKFSVPPQIKDAVVPSLNPAGLIWATLVPVCLDVRSQLVSHYKKGSGIIWTDRDPLLADTTCNFFKPLYEGLLVSSLPDAVKNALDRGGTLVEIGCGAGVGCCVLASAFPKSTISGYDISPPAIKQADALSKEKGLSNVSFAIADAAKPMPNPGTVDACCFLDCLHDMSAPTAAAKNAFDLLKPGGIAFLIEPMGAAEDSTEDTIALPTTAMFSAFSCTICLVCSMSNNGEGLGTVTPTSKYKDIFVTKCGFKSLVAAESPVNAAGFRMMVATK